MTDERYKVAVPTCLDPEDAEAVFRVVEGDALNQPCKDFLGWRTSGLCHAGTRGFVPT
jgi:hypothetical protein